MRIAIASDHAATDLKASLAEWLMDEGHEVADLGPEPGESVEEARLRGCVCGLYE